MNLQNARTGHPDHLAGAASVPRHWVWEDLTLLTSLSEAEMEEFYPAILPGKKPVKFIYESDS